MTREIPEGPYCYSRDKYNNKVYCPHYSHRVIWGVEVNYCEYLKMGGLSVKISEEEFDKLTEAFGSEGLMYDFLPLSLLFDAVKECGKNDGDENYTGEKYTG